MKLVAAASPQPLSTPVATPKDFGTAAELAGAKLGESVVAVQLTDKSGSTGELKPFASRPFGIVSADAALQTLPAGTSFNDAVAAAQKMAAKLDEIIQSKTNLHPEIITDAKTSVGVLQARDGAYVLAMLSSSQDTTYTSKEGTPSFYVRSTFEDYANCVDGMDVPSHTVPAAQRPGESQFVPDESRLMKLSLTGNRGESFAVTQITGAAPFVKAVVARDTWFDLSNTK